MISYFSGKVSNYIAQQILVKLLALALQIKIKDCLHFGKIEFSLH